MSEQKQSHAVYSLTYHIVLVTKYRRHVLTGGIEAMLETECTRLIHDMGGNLIEIETDKDHVHLLAELAPNKSLSEQINVLKGVTSRLIRKNYGDVLKQQLCGGALWNASYYIASAGGVTIDTLKQYVESQKTDDHKRKYEKTGKYKNAHRRKRRRANSSTT